VKTVVLQENNRVDADNLDDDIRGELKVVLKGIKENFSTKKATLRWLVI
jgi:hypothetical protein